GQRHRTAGTAAQRHPGFGVPGQLYVRLFLCAGQHFLFHELDVLVGNGVVFHAALRSTVVDHNGDHRRQTLVVNHIVQNGGQVIPHPIGVGGDDDRGVGTRNVLRGNVDADVPLKGAVEAGVKLAVGGVHHELDHL